MNTVRSILFAITILAASAIAASAADPPPAPLQEPAKSLPAPTADVSKPMQAIVGAPLNPDWNKLWKTGEEARAFARTQAANVVAGLPAMRERLDVSVEPSTIDGVRVYIVTPKDIPPENRDK